MVICKHVELTLEGLECIRHLELTIMPLRLKIVRNIFHPAKHTVEILVSKNVKFNREEELASKTKAFFNKTRQSYSLDIIYVENT